MIYSDSQIWLVIVALGIGTFLVRFSFLGMIGDRPLPVWVLRLLRYTPVALLPGIAAPMIVHGGDGVIADPARLIAALVTVAVGWRTGNILPALTGGMAAYYGAGALLSL